MYLVYLHPSNVNEVTRQINFQMFWKPIGFRKRTAHQTDSSGIEISIFP